MEIKNRKASFQYHILDTYVAGIVLTGTEIKSIRLGKVSFTDSYCFFIDGELWLKNLYISIYENGTYHNHEPKRDRKLLLTKKEIKKLSSKLSVNGLTIIPLKLFINDKGLAKVEIALAKGKKEFDKRYSELEKEDKIRIKRDFKLNIR